MFRLKNSEFPVRFLFQQALHHHHHHHHNHRNLIMAYLAGYDPCSHLSKAFSHHPSLPSSSSDRCSYLSFPFLHNLVYANVFGVGRSFRFSLKGCSFDSSGSCSDRNDKIVVKAKAKPRGFASSPRQHLLVDFEQGNSVRGDGLDAALINVDSGSVNGSPTKLFPFRNHRLSQKIVVAVDVDEGMCA